jgi:hypothetical protein
MTVNMEYVAADLHMLKFCICTVFCIILCIINRGGTVLNLGLISLSLICTPM